MDLLGLRRIDGIVGQDGQGHFGALGPADHVHDAAQFHPDDVDDFAALLLHGHYLVVHMDLAAQVSWSARFDLAHDAMILIEAQHRANPDERKLHLDAEILQGVGG